MVTESCQNVLYNLTGTVNKGPSCESCSHLIPANVWTKSNTSSL